MRLLSLILPLAYNNGLPYVREQGLDEDWSEDALSAEEEVEEDSTLLKSIDEAVSEIIKAKGVHAGELHALGPAGSTQCAPPTLIFEASTAGVVSNVAACSSRSPVTSGAISRI